MPISNSYPKGIPIEDQDLFVGTKAYNNRTANYTAQGVADYLNINSKVAIGGQMSFQFTIVPNIPKTIAFDGGGGNNTAFSAITKLIVSAIDVSTANITIFLNYLNNSQVLLSQQNQPNFFGHYKITGYTQIGTSAFYELDLEFIGGNGTIGDKQYYDLVSFVLSTEVPIPTLQQVTDEGNTTTNDIIVSKATGTSFIQVANNNNALTLQVDSTFGSLIELNDSNNNNYGSLSCGELLMTSGASSQNVQLNSNFLSIQSGNVKPSILLSGTDFTLTGSVEIKTDLVDGTYTQQLPDKSGTFAMLDDIPASLIGEITIDSYIGSRLQPTNTSSNGFWVNRSVNGSVGYSTRNQNTGNGAVAGYSAGIDSNNYLKTINVIKFGPNYYVPLLAGKGGLVGTEEVFVGSYDGNDVSILTGSTFASITRKFTVKADGQLLIQTTPTTGTTSDKLLVRDTSGNIKQIDYPTIPTAVTSVTATSPITSSGGTTPDISTSMATNKLIGRSTAGTGVMEEITIGTGLTLSGGILNGSATGVTSVGLTMPSAFTVTNSPITSSGDIAVTGAGLVSQYVRGDGTLANFPNSTGGGSSVNYYLNGSVSQGTFGGTTYYQMSKTPILGAGTNFTRTNGAGNGYIASFITDAGDPSFLNIPGGNWNVEFYFNASSGGGSPSFYAELYKVSATNVFTLIASDSLNPEGITNGTVVDQYFTSIPVPQTTLLVTDRLAIRIFVNTGGRTITLHTENGNLSEVLTTFTTGLTALNGLTDQVQFFDVGTGATNFNISSSGDTHTFNLLFNIRRNANNSSNNNINYNGYAVTGSAESSAVWTITRLTIAASGSITVATATNVAWTNRESATYT